MKTSSVFSLLFILISAGCIAQNINVKSFSVSGKDLLPIFNSYDTIACRIVVNEANHTATSEFYGLNIGSSTPLKFDNGIFAPSRTRSLKPFEKNIDVKCYGKKLGRLFIPDIHTKYYLVPVIEKKRGKNYLCYKIKLDDTMAATEKKSMNPIPPDQAGITQLFKIE